MNWMELSTISKRTVYNGCMDILILTVDWFPYNDWSLCNNWSLCNDSSSDNKSSNLAQPTGTVILQTNFYQCKMFVLLS